MFILKLIPSRTLSLQARRPSGIIGRYLMTKIFNRGNADLNDFVKELLELQEVDNVLEIGFGPGRLIDSMAQLISNGHIDGVDFSDAMLQQARSANKKHILKGIVNLYLTDCNNLPFQDESYNKICSTNTIYFWSDPIIYFREMYRVAKPNCKIVIGFRDKQQMSNLNLEEDIFNSFTVNDVLSLLLDVGFVHAYIKEKEGIPFVSKCAIAIKA